jgi:hypothetical protein
MLYIFKGTVPPNFRLQVFFMKQFPTSPEYTIRAVSNFVENSWRLIHEKNLSKNLLTLSFQDQ